MADSNPPSGGEASSSTKPEIKIDPKPPKAPLKPPNPMWKYLGFGENFRPRLPSRNWSIFLAITGGFTAAVIYDKREKNRVQRKWCKLVQHIAHEPLGDPMTMPRKLTVFLEGPPTDGLRVAQDHFKEYVKPILVASGLDWEFIQGRKEGDIRAELATKIRNSRLPVEERTDETPIEETRRKAGIKEFEGPKGDIVIGRHTWKEYVRGVHEGWLGPLIEPPKPESPPSDSQKEERLIETLPGITINSTPRDADSPLPETPETPEDKPSDTPKKPPKPDPYISTSAYPSAPTPSDLPSELAPSIPIVFPHILGFLNTPKRLYRFLNRRVLADQIGRETAAIILSTYRPYHTSSTPSPPTSFTPDSPSSPDSPQSQPTTPTQESEIQTSLSPEEKEWHKSTFTHTEGEKERTWLEPIILDPRIASRMRRAELSAEDEERAKGVVVTEEEIEGWIKGSLRGVWREGVKWVKGEGKSRGPNVGDIDSEE